MKTICAGIKIRSRQKISLKLIEFEIAWIPEGDEQLFPDFLAWSGWIFSNLPYSASIVRLQGVKKLFGAVNRQITLHYSMQFPIKG